MAKYLWLLLCSLLLLSPAVPARAATLPTSFPAVVSMIRNIGVPSPQTQGANVWRFASWSDGGAASHNITVPGTNTTYTVAWADATPPDAPTLRSPDNGATTTDTTPNLSWNSAARSKSPSRPCPTASTTGESAPAVPTAHGAVGAAATASLSKRPRHNAPMCIGIA